MSRIIRKDVEIKNLFDKERPLEVVLFFHDHESASMSFGSTQSAARISMTVDELRDVAAQIITGCNEAEAEFSKVAA